MVLVKVTFSGGGIIELYFFQKEAGGAITVNGEGYRSIFSNFLSYILYEMDSDKMRFEQDGPTYQTAQTMMNILPPATDIL